MLMTPDPRWLEILKASGWQTGAVAFASGSFLFLGKASVIPPLEPWMIHLATITLLVCGFLAAASFISAALKFFSPQRWIIRKIKLWRARNDLTKYIPFMTENEKRIIAYLLHKNQKTFTASSDGGHAGTLLSRGIVVVTLKDGQHVDLEHVPMTIPDYVWSVLNNHKAEFKYNPIYNEKNEVHPWRTGWM